MEKIRELQRQLANIQKTDNISKISDRVVVDIMNKLIQTFEMKLIYSRDGTEYITENALCKAIQDLVIEKGRINSLELPDMLNIHAEKIEQQMDNVCTHPTIKLYNISGELLTSEYLDKLVLDLSDELQILLKCTFSDLAIKYHLPKNFLQEQIEERLGTLLQHGVIKGEEIVTEGFVETQKAKVRGLLRGAIQPVYLKEYDKEIAGIQEITQQLIDCNDLDGKIKDNSSFIPTRFIRNQESITRGFFLANNYLEFSMLEKQLCVHRPKDFVKSLFKEQAVFVEGGLVFNKDALENLKLQIPQLLEIEGWTDLTVMFPSAFTESQIEILVKSYVLGDCTSKYILYQGYIFSDAYLQKCALKFKDKIVNYIYNAPQKLITDEKQDDRKGKKKGGKKKNTQSSNQKGMFSSEEIIQCLIETKIIEQDDRDFDFEEKLCEVLQPKVLEFYQKIKEELFENKKTTTTEIIQQIQKKIEERMVSLQFIVRSLQFVEQKHTKVDTTVFHKSALIDAKLVFDNLLMLICKKHLIQLPQNLFLSEQTPSNYNEETDLKYIFKDSNTRELVIEKIPKDFQKPFKELHELAFKETGVYKFVEQVQNNSELFGIKIMQDKKMEKNFFYYQKHMAREKCKSIKEIADPIGLGFYVCVFLLSEQVALYFCDKFEKKALMQIILIVQEVLSYDTNILDTIQQLINFMTKNQESNGSNSQIEALQTKVINDLLKLVKL